MEHSVILGLRSLKEILASGPFIVTWPSSKAHDQHFLLIMKQKEQKIQRVCIQLWLNISSCYPCRSKRCLQFHIPPPNMCVLGHTERPWSKRLVQTQLQTQHRIKPNNNAMNIAFFLWHLKKLGQVEIMGDSEYFAQWKSKLHSKQKQMLQGQEIHAILVPFC